MSRIPLSKTAGGDYEMWVEKKSGSNVTFNYGFTGCSTEYMEYNRPVYISDGFDCKLNIGTSMTTFATATFTGNWTPNYK